jgi:xylan 1,4-beta-xylosidase
MNTSYPDSHPKPYQTTVVVDANRQCSLRRIWRYVGYDECNYTYSPNGRSLLSKLGRMADGPYFVRAHYLLCSGDGKGRPKWGSTNVYTEDRDSNPVYDWTIIDRIFDTWLETGCIPFIELGFMPQAMTSAPKSVSYDDPSLGGWTYPPKDYVRWQGLVQALAQHCLERYGLRDVSRWYWELWNEPDLSNIYWPGTVEEYCCLYDHTVAGLTAVLPQARIGGPATADPGSPKAGAFLCAFLKHCISGINAVTGRCGTRLDFISFHSKGAGSEVFSPIEKHTPTIGRLVENVAAGLTIAASFPELRGREVIVSECDPDGWAAGSMHDSANLEYRNTEYYASYVATVVCKLIDLAADSSLQVDGMLTWAFEFEDRAYFEGLRALSTNDIDKPVLNVFRLLAELGAIRLHLTSDAACVYLDRETSNTPQTPPSISGVAAMNGLGEVQILLCSHHDDWDVTTPTEVRIEVAGTNPGRNYRLRRMVIDSVHNNAYTAWVKMGRPQNPSEEQICALKRLSVPKMAEEIILPVTNDRCTFTLSMATHCVCLVKLTPT